MNTRCAIGILSAVLFGSAAARGDETEPCPGVGCGAAVDAWFADEVWPKVASLECVKCHKKGGDAEDTRFVLTDLSRAQEAERVKLLRRSRDAFVKMARLRSNDQPLLLLKVVGELDHGGKQVLKPDSAGYRILAPRRPGPWFGRGRT